MRDLHFKSANLKVPSKHYTNPILHWNCTVCHKQGLQFKPECMHTLCSWIKGNIKIKTIGFYASYQYTRKLQSHNYKISRCTLSMTVSIISISYLSVRITRATLYCGTVKHPCLHLLTYSKPCIRTELHTLLTPEKDIQNSKAIKIVFRLYIE